LRHGHGGGASKQRHETGKFPLFEFCALRDATLGCGHYVIDVSARKVTTLSLCWRATCWVRTTGLAAQHWHSRVDFSRHQNAVLLPLRPCSAWTLVKAMSASVQRLRLSVPALVRAGNANRRKEALDGRRRCRTAEVLPRYLLRWRHRQARFLSGGIVKPDSCEWDAIPSKFARDLNARDLAPVHGPDPERFVLCSGSRTGRRAISCSFYLLSLNCKH